MASTKDVIEGQNIPTCTNPATKEILPCSLQQEVALHHDEQDLFSYPILNNSRSHHYPLFLVLHHGQPSEAHEQPTKIFMISESPSMPCLPGTQKNLQDLEVGHMRQGSHRSSVGWG